MTQVGNMRQNSKDSNQSKPWALVTGASAGIGREFCRQLAGKGYHLVLVARRRDRLQAVADELKESFGTQSVMIVADLSQSQASEAIVRRIEEEDITVEYLVNNAGYGLPGSFMFRPGVNTLTSSRS